MNRAFPLAGLFSRKNIPIGTRLPKLKNPRREPDWKQADPSWIDRALACSQKRSSGGWWVADVSSEVGQVPRSHRIDGQEVVLWRSKDGVHAAPAACPHMGADLSCASVHDGKLRCPWHGLELGPQGHGTWRPYPCHDDGVLVWIRLAPAEQPTDAPIQAERPKHGIEAVIRMEAQCEPLDIVANRLDPWHGVHYHPHSFADLNVLEQSKDEVVLRVAYRAFGPFCVEVDARFHSPERNSIVMTIVAGEGKGSIVSTHATPIDEGRTMVTEVTFATSERMGFRIAEYAGGLLEPFIKRRARLLWIDDIAYAERRYQLRTGKKRASASNRAETTSPTTDGL
ncbi:MAG: DUF5914 domain-containing protein [Myxococcota bacterium]